MSGRPHAKANRMSVIFISPHGTKPSDRRWDVTDQHAPQHPPVRVSMALSLSALVATDASPLSGSAALASCLVEEDPQQQPFDGLSGIALSGLIFDGIFVFSITKCLMQGIDAQGVATLRRHIHPQ